MLYYTECYVLSCAMQMLEPRESGWVLRKGDVVIIRTSGKPNLAWTAAEGKSVREVPPGIGCPSIAAANDMIESAKDEHTGSKKRRKVKRRQDSILYYTILYSTILHYILYYAIL